MLKEVVVRDGVLKVHDKHLFVCFRKGFELKGIGEVMPADALTVELYLDDYGFPGHWPKVFEGYRGPANYQVPSGLDGLLYDRALILIENEKN